MQMLEKLVGNVCRNGAVDSQLLGYRLKCEDYSIKTFPSVYPSGLNKQNYKIDVQNQTKS